jgi:hypothetical protein
MSEQLRANRYRQLFAKISGDEAHHLADKLQVLALTNPDMLQEFEGFIGREGGETAPAPNSSGDGQGAPPRDLTR